MRPSAFAHRCMQQIERYKRAWSARLDAGFYGAILPEEEGKVYGEATMRNGKLVLPEHDLDKAQR